MNSNRYGTNKINCTSTLENATRGNNILIGSMDSSGVMSISANPTAHYNTVSARAECKRLAATNPGRSYVMLVLSGLERSVPQPMNTSI